MREAHQSGGICTKAECPICVPYILQPLLIYCFSNILITFSKIQTPLKEKKSDFFFFFKFPIKLTIHMTNYPAEPSGGRLVFCSTVLACNIYFLKTAFCTRVSSFGCSEATDQQISYPPGLILWFIFLMLLPLLHVSSPESLCTGLCTSCALQVWQEKNLVNQNLWLDGPQRRGHLLCLGEEERSHACCVMFTPFSFRGHLESYGEA